MTAVSPVLLFFLVIIIVGISRGHCVTEDAHQSENVLGDTRGHVGLPYGVAIFTESY
jgi:hypothetical protein